MRLTIGLLGSLLLLSGCVGVGIGPVAIPSGLGVVVDQNYNATIELPDKVVVVRVGGYGGGFGFIGPIVPIFPIIPGVAGISRAEDKLNLYFHIRPRTEATSFDPSAVRVITNSGEISPDIIMQSANCATEPAVNQVGEGQKTITRPECFQLKFLKDDPPWPNFKVVSKELPELSYRMERKAGVGLLGQR